MQAPSQSEEENQYLRRNADHLRKEKHRLEAQVRHLEARTVDLEQRSQQYQSLYKEAQRDALCGRGGGDMEIQSLHQQLSAVVLLKDALNTENLELRRRIESSERVESDESKQIVCVICMDNLCNLVCLPCKHLALCTYCGQKQDVTTCPICRTELKEKMQIYTP